jgi:predicted metal-dependent hydrolase
MEKKNLENFKRQNKPRNFSQEKIKWQKKNLENFKRQNKPRNFSQEKFKWQKQPQKF